MSQELAQAIQQIAEEKKLSIDAVKETIELALAAAYRKDFGNKQQNIKVNFDIETGLSKITDVKTVVADELVADYQRELAERAARGELGTDRPKSEQPTMSENQSPAAAENQGEPAEDEKKFNPKTMIGLAEASLIQPGINIGDELIQHLEPPQAYGRMAAQTAKQVIIQKIREAERENVYNTFKEHEHELVTGMIQRVEHRIVLVDIDKSTAVMPAKEQIPNEHYRVGARLKFYIREVNQTPKGPEILVSRNHPEILRKLFMIEVPEITSGAVVIRAIAREAGARSKIAVASKEANIDPIGACVGQRGTRVQTIINELGGEKIDIIQFAEDTGEFIANSLSPAKVLRVELTNDTKTAKAFVREDQLSLAIGKGGQNVRLAAHLTGWRLDIVEEDTGEVKMTSVEENTEPATAENQVVQENSPPDETKAAEPAALEPLAESLTEAKPEEQTSEKNAA